MRQHPISPVTEPMQYRAIGVVRGHYQPTDPEQLTRGVLRTEDGTELEAVVLGRLLTLMRRHLDLAEPHLWVVYPRSRDQEHLHLQLVGVWEPSTLAAGALEPDGTPDDALPEGDDYFSLRGELVYTRPESGDLVVKVRQQPRADGSRPVPFKVPVKGEVPLEHLRHFVALDLRRQGQELQLERFEVIGPLSQRGTRGGRNRPAGNRSSGNRGAGNRGGSTRGPANREGGEGRKGEERQGASAAAGGGRRPGHGDAISRPTR